MIRNSASFTSCIPLFGKDKVKITDGQLSPIIRKGVIIGPSGLYLQDVLHVSKFSHSLLSIAAIKKLLRCTITFSTTYCVFKEPKVERVIGHGSHHEGLYFLVDCRMRNKLCSDGQLSVELVVSSKHNYVMWYRRLGHHLLKIFELLDPLCYQNWNKDMLKCKACELEKYSISMYPISGNKS